MGVTGVLTVTLAATATGTDAVVTYRLFGNASHRLGDMASGVDPVIRQQLRGLHPAAPARLGSNHADALGDWCRIPRAAGTDSADVLSDFATRDDDRRRRRARYAQPVGMTHDGSRPSGAQPSACMPRGCTRHLAGAAPARQGGVEGAIGHARGNGPGITTPSRCR
jgi:hypothetical protein